MGLDGIMAIVTVIVIYRARRGRASFRKDVDGTNYQSEVEEEVSNIPPDSQNTFLTLVTSGCNPIWREGF